MALALSTRRTEAPRLFMPPSPHAGNAGPARRSAKALLDGRTLRAARSDGAGRAARPSIAASFCRRHGQASLPMAPDPFQPNQSPGGYQRRILEFTPKCEFVGATGTHAVTDRMDCRRQPAA